MGSRVGGGAGAGVAEEPGTGLGRHGGGRAGERRHEGRRRLASNWHKHLSIWVKAQTLGLLCLWISFTLSDHPLSPLAVTAEAWRVLQVENLHCPLLSNLVGYLVGVNPHAELCRDICTHFLCVQSTSLGGQFHHGVPRCSQVDAPKGRTPERGFRIPVTLKTRHQYPLQLLPKQVSSTPRQLVVQVGHDEVEGDLNFKMHGCTGSAPS